MRNLICTLQCSPECNCSKSSAHLLYIDLVWRSAVLFYAARAEALFRLKTGLKKPFTNDLSMYVEYLSIELQTASIPGWLLQCVLSTRQR
jgi:hypothetical protein